MRLEIKAVGVTAFLILSGAASHSSAAATAFTHGSSCNPRTPSDSAYIQYSRFGVSNPGNGSMNVVCPLNTLRASALGNSEPNQFYATLYDRTSTDDVSCTVYRLDVAGNIVETATNHTTSYSWLPTTLAFNLSSTTSSPFTYDAECYVPPSGNYGPSYVVSFTTFYP
jgi:hypothetical protein